MIVSSSSLTISITNIQLSVVITSTIRTIINILRCITIIIIINIISVVIISSGIGRPRRGPRAPRDAVPTGPSG